MPAHRGSLGCRLYIAFHQPGLDTLDMEKLVQYNCVYNGSYPTFSESEGIKPVT